MEQRIIISRNFETELATALTECEHDRIFVIADTTTTEKCWPLVKDFFCLHGARLITIGATDINKNLDSLVSVWKLLQEGGATRHSCIINLGGGMVTDLGGFAASTFKRGLNFINVPTTLLAMVDASVGGKTGINFGGLKNEIGVFNDANCVILNTQFLKTLDDKNIRSGYAEMLKHGLISDEKHWAELVNFDISSPDLHKLAVMLGQSVKVKERIVDEDPREKGIRKALNLGHTFGHAFESFSLATPEPLLHGYAVAFGLIPELYLSAVREGFPQDKLRQTVTYIRENYGRFAITCDDYPRLIELMHHDKKNTGNEINVTLLAGVGDIHIDQTISEEEVKEALDFFREG
ncbi:MAG: 3-dehydroquinate synthase [Prevotella sp.]|uniref:3-dehydroquinate synthase n=1 Tax=Prevotella sp. TaxID=59823 RepID=UPI002588D989|nr:3-dehydroquinate synthase [Prevotella sp.]MDD6853570.1 3-dehydroquinate synthase [Prevotella sp.]